jgi:hypothetical protein
MALEGAICYLDIPLGKAHWNYNMRSPFTTERSGSSGHFWQIDIGCPQLELKAEAQKFLLLRSNMLRRRLIFDTALETDLQDLRCVVVGREKSTFAGEKQKHYVLVIRNCPSGEPNAFERVGVGVIERMHIAFTEQGRNVRII